MDTDGLFSLAPPDVRSPASTSAEAAGFAAPAADAPLPVRMRPASIDELVGQEHLLAPGAPLRQLVTGSSPMSVILWGPPGTGKTTIAHLVAHATDRKFVAMSALTAGVKDVRAVIDTARRERRYGGPPTVLFIDEVHRFSKTQQDSCSPRSRTGPSRCSRRPPRTLTSRSSHPCSPAACCSPSRHSTPTTSAA